MIWKLRVLIKQIFVKLFSKNTKLFKDELYIKILYFITFSKWPNLVNPKTFNENICRLKLDKKEFDYAKYTDKYEVRSYVSSKVGDKYLNENFGVYERVEDINLDKLPNKFVFKGTHGSGYNILIQDKKSLDVSLLKDSFGKWRKENFYYPAREKNYFNIKPRIVTEKLIEPLNGVIFEYKIFCFHGKPQFLQYNFESEGKRCSNIYDVSWNKIPVTYGYKSSSDFERPASLEEALFVAKELASPFEFVRVDLYNADEKVIFSELTFHSGGGYIPFTPKSYDEEFGKYFLEGK